ncbi:MAG: DUF6084 family protein [Nocardioidaceae bacterium]
MVDVDFTVVDVAPEPFAAAPQLVARLRVDEGSGAVVHAIALRCQLRIEAQRRPYDDKEAGALGDQFGSRDRWSTTLKPFMWLQCSTMVQGFTGTTEVDLPMPVTYDLDVTASKYLHALADGEVPLAFLFSGTVFTRGANGFGVEQVPWDRESSYRMPVSVWHDVMKQFYPGMGWLRLPHDTLAELARYKAARGLTTWESVMDALLAGTEEVSHEP